MNIRDCKKQDLYKYLYEKNTLVVATGGDKHLDQVLEFYVEYLELKCSQHTVSGVLNSETNTDYLILGNIGAAARLLLKYNYLFKIGYAWTILRWIKVTIHGQSPHREFHLSYAEDHKNVPAGVWGR